MAFPWVLSPRRAAAAGWTLTSSPTRDARGHRGMRGGSVSLLGRSPQKVEGEGLAASREGSFRT